jgi:hypothetical protein
MSDFEQERVRAAALDDEAASEEHPQHQAPDERTTADPPSAPPTYHGVRFGELLQLRALPWAAVVIAVTALAGALLALLWSALGPHVGVLMTVQGPILAEGNTEQFAGGDVRYAELTALAGLLAGVAVWQLRRWRGPLLVIALALGGLVGAYITAKLGTEIGRDAYEGLLKTAPRGREFSQPMNLRAEGLQFLQAIVAVTAYMVLAAWSRFPDLGIPQPTTPVSSSPSEPAAEPAESAPPAAGTASSPPA